MRRAIPGTGRALPEDLTEAITRAGYYPSLVCDVVESAVADDEVVSHLVHQETTFDHETVRRHVTVLVVTPKRLVIAHADDHAESDDKLMATATTEQRFYIHSPERVVAVVTRGDNASSTRYVHVDHLGSVDVLSDEKGGEHDRRSYDAFGARRNPTWGQPPPASFSSETAAPSAC